MRMEQPLLSVCLITYNHAPFIRQAIDGVLMQKVNFSWELIIADDCSTDSTREILLDYKNKYPEFIKLILQEKNVGPANNWMELLSAPSSKYIAYFEGDDYWTHELKLQKQVDFLEENNDFSICFHKATIIYENGIAPFYPDINKDTKEITTLRDIAKGNYMHTPTIVFRNILKGDFPEWFKTAYPGDWPLHVINAIYGKIKFIPIEMSIYRVHSNGVHSTKNSIDMILRSLPTIKNIESYLKEKHEYSASKIALNTYRHYIFSTTAVRNTFKKNRWERGLLFIKYGILLKSIKIMAVFWLPIFFGNKTEEVWIKIVQLKKMFRLSHIK